MDLSEGWEDRRPGEAVSRQKAPEGQSCCTLHLHYLSTGKTATWWKPTVLAGNTTPSGATVLPPPRISVHSKRHLGEVLDTSHFTLKTVLLGLWLWLSRKSPHSKQSGHGIYSLKRHESEWRCPYDTTDQDVLATAGARTQPSASCGPG